MAITKPTPLFDTLEHLSNALYEVPAMVANYKIDYQFATRFLYSYRGSPASYNSYRRELEIFSAWTWFVKNKNFKEIKREHFEEFIEFRIQPPESWIGNKNVPRFIDKAGERIPNSEWRPFVAKDKKYNLSQKALQATFAILGSFYSFLVQENYIDFNPVVQIRQKSKFIRKEQAQRSIRRLSELQWAYVIETAEIMANQNPAKHERTLFIMSALYGMYLRISELVASKRWEPQMGDFHKDADNNWWFTTVGKGNKKRLISVSNSMLNALKRYRKSRGYTQLPAPGDITSLIPKERGSGPIASTRHIRTIVQECFDQAIDRLKQDGFDEDAQMLSAATVHWLRHTGISDDVKFRPREHVRDDAGHSSSAITDKYIDIELRERHKSAEKKKINPDEKET
jgi:site-specific recombinase XerD